MRYSVYLAAVLGAVLAPSACDSGLDSLCDYKGACSDGGGLDVALDGKPPIDAPVGCDLTKDPKDSTACIDDSVGVFVSPTGNDANPGTKASPVKTLTNALTKLGAKPRVYVCEGNYPGSVEIKTSVSVYGALKCDWTAGGARPVLTADKPAFGVQLEAASITLADIEVDGADGVADGESSVAILANAATGAVLTRVKAVAGAGKNGKAGTTGSNYTPLLDQSDPSIAGSDVKLNTPSAGGVRHDCTLCKDTKNSSGGPGGNGDVASPTMGGVGLPNLGGLAPKDGVGGAAGIGCGSGTGHDGANGGPGTVAPKSSALSNIDSSGWKPGSGADGVNGGVAQGAGGGGGGISSSKGGGGGGGCGGCGGGFGTGGTGGGASIGLLSVASNVTLNESELVSKQAGNGGAGAAGQTGQLGGAGGTPASFGCSGGTGGTGGAGGSGSGGAGGVSAAIAFKGTAPTVDSATTAKLTPGTLGTQGTGGSPGTNDGPNGVSQPIFECKAPLCN